MPPPQIPPAAIVGGGRAPRRGLGEQLLLGLVQQAPQAIFQILEMRRQGQQEEATGEASRNILASLTEAGQFGPELTSALEAAGAQITPGSGPLAESQIPQISPQVAQQGDLAVPQQQAAVGGTPGAEPQTDLSAIDPRNATELLQRFLATQESISGIEAQRATAGLQEARTGLTETQREGAEIQNRTNEIQRQIAEATQGVQERLPQARLDLIEAQTAGELARAERLRNEIDTMESSQEREIIAGAEELVDRDFQRFRETMATLGQLEITPDSRAAQQRASMMIFGTPTPPTRSELRTRKRAILRGAAPGPTDEQERSRLAGQIGLRPQDQQFIDQALIQRDSPEDAWNRIKEVVREDPERTEEEKAQDLLIYGLYLEGVTGTSLNIRKDATAEEKSILRSLFREGQQLFQQLSGAGASPQELEAGTGTSGTLEQFRLRPPQ